MTKIFKFLNYIICAISALSFINNMKAASLESSSRYIGIEYNYPMRTSNNDFQMTINSKMANVYMINNGGGAISSSLTYIINENVFFNLVAGYSKQKYSASYDGNIPGFIDYKMIEGGLNIGYVLDIDSNIIPYGSFGLGISGVKTEMKFHSTPKNFLTNIGNNPSETKPHFSYEGGLNFVTNNGIIKVGLNGKIIQDLDSNLSSENLNLIDESGNAVIGGYTSPFKNHIYSLSLGILIPI